MKKYLISYVNLRKIADDALGHGGVDSGVYDFDHFPSLVEAANVINGRTDYPIRKVLSITYLEAGI